MRIGKPSGVPVDDKVISNTPTVDDSFDDKKENEKKLISPFGRFLILGFELPMLLLASYLIVSLYNLLLIGESASVIGFVGKINVSNTLLLLLLLFTIFVLLRLLNGSARFSAWLVLATSYLFAGVLIMKMPKDFYMTIAVIVILGLITSCILEKEKELISDDGNRSGITFLILLLAVLVIVFIDAYISITRFHAYRASNFDLGIFSQVFEYMRTTGLPLTSTERDHLISHFTVHFSPIYYMLLPGYLLFPQTEYLLVVQAIFVCSASIPLYLICRNHALSSKVSMMIAMIYLLHPGALSPTLFDFHENKFIPFLLLWMLYFWDSKKYVPMYLFLALTLFVKEDTSLFILFLGLLLAKQNKKHGLIIAITSLVYFVTVIMLMKRFGEGIMEYRFADYFQPGESGLVTMSKNIAMNPAFFIKNLFSEEKLQFISYMFLPILFLPFRTRDVKNFVVFLPMILLNIMPLYPYQFDIGFQYTYGILGIIMYIFVQRMRDMTPNQRWAICLVGLFAAVSLTVTKNADVVVSNYRYEQENVQAIGETNRVLESIPPDAIVTASTFLVPHLSHVKLLYMYPSKNTADIIILDIRTDDSKIADNIDRIISDGYYLKEATGFAMVYSKE